METSYTPKDISGEAVKRVAQIKKHFQKNDLLLFSVMKTMRFEPLTVEKNPKLYFSKLCGEIAAQQLSGKAADTIFKRFLKLFPRERISPNGVLKYSDGELRQTGISWAKARYLRDLAEKTRSRELQFSNIQKLPDEGVIRELTKVKGIGRWTAEMFLIFTLGREDVFSFGDLGLRKGLERVYGKKRVSTQKRIETIIGRWHPYCSYGSLALWHVIDSGK